MQKSGGGDRYPGPDAVQSPDVVSIPPESVIFFIAYIFGVIYSEILNRYFLINDAVK